MSEYDSRAETLAHIHAVRDCIGVFVTEMLHRARTHDASKLSPEEKPVFDQVFPLLRGVSYGSAEWDEAVQRAAPALAHHYRRNSHHPEHYAEGVAGMDLFDVVEMLCDWIAAAERNPGDGVRMDLNVRAFGIEPQPASILANTLARWPKGEGALCRLRQRKELPQSITEKRIKLTDALEIQRQAFDVVDARRRADDKLAVGYYGVAHIPLQILAGYMATTTVCAALFELDRAKSQWRELERGPGEELGMVIFTCRR